jgi:hypothetical protein
MGEMSLLLKAPRSATARAISYCDVFVLTKDNLDEVMGYYPESAKEIQSRTEHKRKHMIQHDKKLLVLEPVPGITVLTSTGSNSVIDTKEAVIASPPPIMKQPSLELPANMSPLLSYHRTISTVPSQSLTPGEVDPNAPPPWKPRCGSWVVDSNGE